MTPTQAIAPKILKAATEKLAACSEFPERLGWWLQHGHSSERWVQFEWAYRLQEVLGAAFSVLCEHRRLDVSLVGAANGNVPLWEAEPIAGVELKWWGNWWVDMKAVEELAADLAKVEVRDCPAAAVLLLLVVDPKENPTHQWISQQIARGRGVSSVAQVRERYLSRLNRIWDFDTQIDLPFAESLQAASLHVFVFFNQRARAADKATNAAV